MSGTIRRISVWVSGAALAAGLGGCGQNLVYVHNSVLGVDVSGAADGTARVALGYDSDTFAVVPRVNRAGDAKHGDAMTLVSVSNVDVDGLDEVVFNHVIATGDAARNAARDPEGLRLMRAAVFGSDAGNGK